MAIDLKIYKGHILGQDDGWLRDNLRVKWSVIGQ